MKTLTIDEAISEVFADGHTIWKVEYAKAACEAVGVKFPTRLARKFESDPAGTFKGLTMKEENSEGVDSLHLSDYVVEQLKLKVGSFGGRGFQAQANARAIREHLAKK